MDALDAIVFSGAALEAFIDEVMSLASQEFPGLKPGPDSIKSFASLVFEVEQFHGSIILKFLLANEVFTGRTYDKGAQPYQDFALLIELRNAIVHIKSREEVELDTSGFMISNPPRVIQGLSSRKITAEFDPPDLHAALISHVSTRAVARWALLQRPIWSNLS